MAAKSQILHARGRRIRSSNIISYVIAILIGGLILGAVYMAKESRNWLALGKGKTLSSCNLFSGKWVYDDESYPLYKDNHCSFMSIFNGVSCERTGRTDSKYQHWRWQPHDCDLPRSSLSLKHARTHRRANRNTITGTNVSAHMWTQVSYMRWVGPSVTHNMPLSKSFVRKFFLYPCSGLLKFGHLITWEF